jgi:hypothetical protein
MHDWQLLRKGSAPYISKEVIIIAFSLIISKRSTCTNFKGEKLLKLHHLFYYYAYWNRNLPFQMRLHAHAKNYSGILSRAHPATHKFCYSHKTSSQSTGVHLSQSSPSADLILFSTVPFIFHDSPQQIHVGTE